MQDNRHLFNRGFLLAYAGLLTEAATCLESVLVQACDLTQTLTERMKAVGNLAMVRLRIPDFKGVLALFDDYLPDLRACIDD